MQKMLFLSFLLVGSLASAQLSKVSILQGTTSESVTHFTVVAPQDQDLKFDVSGPGRVFSVSHLERVTQEGSQWVVYRMRVDGLTPNTPYELDVRSSLGQLVDQRRFQSLDRNRATGKVAFGSCMVTQFHNPYMWRAIEKENPDLILLLGDAVYLDHPSLFSTDVPKSQLEVWQRFVDSRNTLGLYFWKDLKPVVTIWDDHDSGYNNDDAHFPLMKAVRFVYDTFMANDAIAGFLTQGPALAKQFEVFGRNFILLDGRSYRDLDPDSPLFGKEQEDWLNAQIRPGQNLVMSGSQFYGGYIKKDSLEYNWPEYSKKFTARLRQTGEQKGASLIFGSGDVHYSEVQLLEPSLYGYESVEITSSSIHSFAFPGHYLLKPDNPRRITATGTHNAVMLEFNRDQTAFQARSVGWRGNDLFSVRINVRSNVEAERNSCQSLLTGT